MIFYEDWMSDPLTSGREPKRVPVDQIPNLASVADTKWRELRTSEAFLWFDDVYRTGVAEFRVRCFQPLSHLSVAAGRTPVGAM